MFPTWARTHALDTGEAVNVLKGAIVTADRILTVSKVIIVISVSVPETISFDTPPSSLEFFWVMF